MDNDSKVGDIIYYARVIPFCDIYEICELTIRTWKDSWFVGVDKRTKQAFLLGNDCIGETVFYNRVDALEKVKKEQKLISQKVKQRVEEDFYE